MVGHGAGHHHEVGAPEDVRAPGQEVVGHGQEVEGHGQEVGDQDLEEEGHGQEVEDHGQEVDGQGHIATRDQGHTPDPDLHQLNHYQGNFMSLKLRCDQHKAKKTHLASVP